MAARRLRVEGRRQHRRSQHRLARLLAGTELLSVEPGLLRRHRHLWMETSPVVLPRCAVERESRLPLRQAYGTGVRRKPSTDGVEQVAFARFCGGLELEGVRGPAYPGKRL